MDATTPYRRLVAGFMAALQSPDADNEALRDAASVLLEQSAGAPDLYLSLLCRSITPLQDHGRAAFGALVAGALVESGADPRPAFLPLAAILARALGPMDRFLERLEAQRTDEEHDPVSDPEARARAAAEEPEGDAAWTALHTLYLPTVAVFSPSAEGRELVRAQLAGAADVLRRHDGGGAFVWTLLQVLDDEPLQVLHPRQGRGARLRISGIADNFQLHVMLMDTLLGGGILPGDPPPQDWVAVARGAGPQELPDTVSGAWDLYAWTALGAGAMDQGPAGSDHWVWNEGVPADIPALDGERVLLLGDAGYQRSWGNSRVFEAMDAAATAEGVLDEDAVQAALQRIREAGPG